MRNLISILIENELFSFFFFILVNLCLSPYFLIAALLLRSDNAHFFSLFLSFFLFFMNKFSFILNPHTLLLFDRFIIFRN